MDELELAKRAIRRNLLTEEQLREARAYAEGGRTLLSVLLDLGFLKPADLHEIFSPASAPPPPRTRLLPYVAAGTATAVLLVVAFSLVSVRKAPRNAVPEIPRPIIIREPAPAGPPLADQLSAIARDHLDGAERQLRETGTLTPQMREQLARAAALYEESIRERPSEVAFRLGLGRARELLDQWEVALLIFRQVVEAHPRDGRALVGMARCLLLLQRPDQALEAADRACAVAPLAEAFLVRARALRSLGRHEAAQRDFDEARRRDAEVGSGRPRE